MITKRILEELTKNAKDIGEAAAALREECINFETVELTSGPRLAVFMAEADEFGVAGYFIVMRGGEISVEEIYDGI